MTDKLGQPRISVLALTPAFAGLVCGLCFCLPVLGPVGGIFLGLAALQQLQARDQAAPAVVLFYHRVAALLALLLGLVGLIWQFLWLCKR